MSRKSLKVLKKEISNKITTINKALPKRVDPAFISHIAKIPYKVYELNASLLWRGYELAEVSLDTLNKNNIASGFLLTRALVETSAMLYYTELQIGKVIAENNINLFDNKIMKLLLGSRNEVTNIDSLNILTIIDTIDKELEEIKIKNYGFRKSYDSLSEFAHPNWQGTHGLYGKINFDDLYTDYGKNINNIESVSVAYYSINASLEMLLVAYNNILDYNENLVNICENDINKSIFLRFC